MIYGQATAYRLALVRVAVFAIWIADLALHPIPELASLPRAWFEPHGPWLLLPGSALARVWNAPFLHVLQGATLVCCLLALLGAPRPRVWAVAAALLITLVTGFVRGFGHADHAQLQLLFLTYALLLLPAWERLRVGALQPAPAAGEAAYAASFAALSLVFTFPYFLTAVYRLTHEGAAIFLDGSMRHFIARDTLMLDHFETTLGLKLLQHRALDPLLAAGFAAVTLAELLAPWAFLRRASSVAWLAIMVPFHALAPPLMHVLFPHNIALMLLLYAWPLCWKRP